MRLDMWMIANRLGGLDYQTHIESDTPQVLNSARLVFAPNCVVLSQQGNDVLCRFGEEYIRIRDMDLKYVFNLVQGIFDTYNDWYTRTVTYAQKNNWQAVVDELSSVLKNPVVFFDANTRVMAMSSAYKDREVDSEWAYLRTHGVSSAKMVRVGYRNVVEDESWSIKIQKTAPRHMNCGLITSRVENGGKTYGYISALELDRTFNEGDAKLLRIFTDILTPPFVYFSNIRMEAGSCNCFIQMLQEQRAEVETVERQLAYFGFSLNGHYRVVVIRTENEETAETDIRLIKQNILFNCEPMPVMLMDGQICVITEQESGREENLLSMLQGLQGSVGFHVGVSGVSDSIWEIGAYYQQALYALKYPADEEGYLHRFECHAMDYFLRNSEKKRLLCACHAGIRNIYMQNNDQNADLLRSLEMYLRHERSLTRASKALFVHKNTLLYRIQKIESQCGCDLEDPSEREYILQSIRVLRLFCEEE